MNGAIAAGELLTLDRRVPTAVYVHEQGEALRVLTPEAEEALVKRANRVICVSQQSHNDLIDLGVPAERLGIIPPVIATRPPPPAGSIAAARSAMADEGSGPLVIGCGEAGWRKGADLFVQVARHLAPNPDLRLAWVGRRGRAFARVVDHDVRALGLDGRVRWVGEVPDPAPYLAAADLLLMTSREDPQPLVPFEAALVGTPTIGFGVGGLVDFAERGEVRTVPYPDVREMALAVEQMLASPASGEKCVRITVDRARGPRSIDVIGPLFLAELRDLFPREDRS